MDVNQTIDVAALKAILARPPVITEDLPGTGGVIKAVPEHFQVEEVLPYAACGEGEHVFVTVRRAGWNTADIAAALGEPFKIRAKDVGWGGRKDKHAVTTQTFSLRLPMDLPLEKVAEQLHSLPFEILGLERHRNKLKTGHVAANRFRIVLSQVEPDALPHAMVIADTLKRTGVPNLYGEQRFGSAYGNLDRAAALIRRGKAHGRKNTFTVSALQSALFNCWLIQRIGRGQFHTLIPGDVARKCDTGGLFVVEDFDEAALRFQARRISYTGPIYGHKMMPAAGQAGEFENQVLERFGLDPGLFKGLRAPGSRRPAVLSMDELAIEPVPDGLLFTFSLPAGAYATTVLREFTRSGAVILPES